MTLLRMWSIYTYKEKKVGMKSIKVSIYADERNVIRWQQVADTHKENQLIERKYQNQRVFWWHGIENVWSDLYEEKQVWTSPRITKNMIVKVAAKNSCVWWLMMTDYKIFANCTNTTTSEPTTRSGKVPSGASAHRLNVLEPICKKSSSVDMYHHCNALLHCATISKSKLN